MSGYELVVCDVSVQDFEDVATEQAIVSTEKSLELTVNEIQFVAKEVARGFHVLAFKHKELNEQLRKAHNELARLRGENTLDKGIDPVSMCDEKGKSPEDREREKFPRREADTAQNIQRQRDRRSKKVALLFKKIAARTHPDKTKDKNLHNVFLVAKEAAHNNDISVLEQILKDVVDYLKIRKSKHLFKNFRQRVLGAKRQALNAERNKIRLIKATFEYKCYKSIGTEKEEEMYKEFIGQQLTAIGEEIQKTELLIKMRVEAMKNILGSSMPQVMKIFTEFL